MFVSLESQIQTERVSTGSQSSGLGVAVFPSSPATDVAHGGIDLHALDLPFAGQLLRQGVGQRDVVEADKRAVVELLRLSCTARAGCVQAGILVGRVVRRPVFLLEGVVAVGDERTSVIIVQVVAREALVAEVRIEAEGEVDVLPQREVVAQREAYLRSSLAEEICLTVENHSSYVQQLAWLVWIHTDNVATRQDFDMAYQDIIDQNTPLFEKQTESLTTNQMNFLRAVLDGVSSEFTTQEVLNKYHLGSSANVSAIKRALVKKELIEIERRQVVIPDPVLKVWLKRELGA